MVMVITTVTTVINIIINIIKVFSVTVFLKPNGTQVVKKIVRSLFILILD